MCSISSPRGEDFLVVRESELRQIARRKGPDLERFIAGVEITANRGPGIGDKDRSVARPRIGTEEPIDADLNAGLLLDLAPRRCFELLPRVNEAGREGPAPEHGLVVTPPEHDLA